ncbi:hypothetical protein E6P09_08755 [Haloferax mediterranei ATCC 33500]|uniref:Uncharacterized protein n=1 Tax=Haloferax mediterranei (strain ATCC 33500 / DSM 1411 / JCM 8866 / NBRC 14739 / NCIMB 2177 / R-4) TaxID=523841 RepID=I3R3Q4_HALMT|nr:hypothetical protein [Haloferax mediterranei]AFK18864.1 hypothetical protein HFX_1148 [Haloferax mediterranei ATCC 33500]AHZ21773.1 hypothetical protein BM92_03470 [Haloferax mediterranei ATCC 33500]EMA03278.1 hypothetical protein C439_04750 [Haloferax mediterranei ATCC 33500]MDX5988957.1 hypothetical protein [Haloferax mediterranei ATCC 33500]QCQ75350.1 hypothetical protein E6P09_08755 [Haloferax mediterranei ATCC 33500]
MALTGILGTLGLEVVLSLKQPLVRAMWDETAVQAAAVGAAIIAVAVSVAVVGPSILVVVFFGTVTYLLLLSAVEFRARRTADSNDS